MTGDLEIYGAAIATQAAYETLIISHSESALAPGRIDSRLSSAERDLRRALDMIVALRSARVKREQVA
jgi:hypothetical protein